MQETVIARVAVGSGTDAPTAVGAAIVGGGPNGVALTGSDHEPWPRALTALTSKVYAVPLVSPLNVCDVVSPTEVIPPCPPACELISTS